MARISRTTGLAAGVVAALALAASIGSDARGAGGPILHANGRIAFAAVGGIASMNQDGSGQWGVELQVGDTAPAWSPDGSRLAVVTHWAGRNGIMVMQPDGSDATMLTNNGGDADPTWSPDGSRIAFADGSQIWVVNADGTGRKELTSGSDDRWVRRPTWSPDGTKIAFEADAYDPAGSSSSVDVLDLASGHETQLTPPTVTAGSPAWSPDGSTIAFSAIVDYRRVIETMNADGTGVTPLTSDGTYDDLPAWAPDGTQIAFTRNSQVWVMARDGSGAHQLTNGDSNTYPAWQPLAPAPPGCTLWGTAGNDLLVGTDGNDVVCGLGGNDTLIGLAGQDRLVGGDGNDMLAGGLGSDLIEGGRGNDTLDARDGGVDYVAGGDGFDRALIDPRFDTLVGVEQRKVDRNLAVWRPATADAAEPTNPAERAVDGLLDDWWNSGGYPTHWLEVDLQQPTAIGLVRLVAPEVPKGASVFLLGRFSTDLPFRVLHVFKGPTVDLQQLSFAPKRPWRGVRYLRLAVPAANAPMPWVSWREIEVYGPTAKKARRHA